MVPVREVAGEPVFQVVIGSSANPGLRVIAPRYLGLRVVIAKSFARIHFQNLANFGILPLRFEDPSDYDSISQGDVLTFDGLRAQLSSGTPVTASLGRREIRLTHDLSERQVAMVLAAAGSRYLRVQPVRGRADGPSAEAAGQKACLQDMPALV